MATFNSYVKLPEGKRPILWVSTILLVVVDGGCGWISEPSTICFMRQAVLINLDRSPQAQGGRRMTRVDKWLMLK
jgi:hypothetical protein